MKHILALLLAATLAAAPHADAFCGFYVAKADTKLFNKASQVVLVRDENRTVLTMANDYQGDPKEFAVVIPVPTFIEREQIHVGDKTIIEHLDAYSAPRLVEYFDEDPCNPVLRGGMGGFAVETGSSARVGARDKALGVKVEASYTVGEYDIVILSAEQSDGLETWLTENGYKIPEGAAEVLGSYIKQKNRFFVAKVNLEKQSKLGFSYLRPLQIAYESRKFMLPIRLGTVNADGPQELFIYCLTRKGRVETTNYRTVKLPTGGEIPLFVKDEFGDFYRAMFDRQVKKEGMKAVFLEYAWDMGWCDPCAAEPLSPKELRSLGVFWLDEKSKTRGRATNVFVTRLHVRYDREHFPEDLVFQQTRDKENFQGRFVLRHPWRGKADCDAAKAYLENQPKTLAAQAETLANLTGWDVNRIRMRMELPEAQTRELGGKKWYQNIWKE